MVLKFLIATTFCFILINAATIKQLQTLVPSETYTHSLIVDVDEPEQYQIFWKLINEEEIQFEVHAKTIGWVGMGLSPDGGMTGLTNIFYQKHV